VSRSIPDWYREIVQACDDASRLVLRGRAEFDGDVLLCRAARNICFEIGEAAKQIEQIERAELERSCFGRWPAVIRMRDFLGHNCPTADLDVLWRTLTDDLPAIARAVERRLRQLSDAKLDE
jgi:uncharacterized protein with HEPN domain